MILWIAFIHFIELIGVVIYFIFRKNIKMEKIIIKQQEQIDSLEFLFNQLTSSLDKVDNKVWVEGDTELMEVFQNVNEIKSTLNSFYN